MVHTPMTAPGSGSVSLALGADLVYKRPPTYPNLILFTASPGNEKISVAPCPGSEGSATVSSEDRICAHLSVQNSGYGATDAAVEVLILLDGSPLETWVIPGAIRPGAIVERRDVSFGPLAPGAHVLRVVIDPDNRIPETSETDNDATVTFVVSPRTVR